MELEITRETMIGSPITFGKQRKLWIVRDLIIIKKDHGRFQSELACLIVARQKAPEFENQVRIVLFSRDDLSGMINNRNNLFLYLNKEKSVTMHLRIVDEPFGRTA